MTGGETTRPAREVLDEHLVSRHAGDLEEDIRRNYHPEVVLLTGTGTFRGHEGVRKSAAELEQYLGPDLTFDITKKLVEGPYAFIEWNGRSGEREVCDGADSFVIVDGLITAQTIHYTVERYSSSP